MADDLIAEKLVIPGRGPMPRIYDAAIAVLKADNRTIVEDEKSGTIATDWYTTHKGEVRLKTEIGISGDYVRVEAWHNTGFIFKSPTKSDWSRRAEEKYTKLINEMIRREAYVAPPLEFVSEVNHGPATTQILAGTIVQFYVQSSQDLFGYFFAPNSAGQPSLISDIIEIKANTKTYISGKTGSKNFRMPQWSMKYGVLVARSKADLQRYLSMVHGWEQFDNLLFIREGQK